MLNLYDLLKDNNKIPFHMPGHKRNTFLLGDKFPYDIDITEIEGFDNLHNPSGVIKNIEDKIREYYKSDNSFILVNGSTAGILAGVAAVLKKGDTVLMARNCHKSVYNAVELIGANAEYIMPDTDEFGIFKSVDISELGLKIKALNPKLIVITSPTYEGVCSNIKGICSLAHSYNIPVIVDSAHGAHNIDDVKYTDITVMSLHKTLPALTQCAAAHINGNLINIDEFRIKLSIFETSSPSYILMSSIEECIDFISCNKNLFDKLTDERNKLLNQCKELNNLKVFTYNDISKIIIFTGYSNTGGVELSAILRDGYNIEVEMASLNYVVLITTICDDFNYYKILNDALIEIDKSLVKRNENYKFKFLLPKKIKNSSEVVNKELINLKDSINRISAEYIWAYPPGIPLIVPGEIITEQLIDYIDENLKLGVNIQSTYSKLPEKIYCQQ